MEGTMGILAPLVDSFRSIIQWSQAVAEICHPRSGTKVHISRDIQIHNLQCPAIPDPRKQATLNHLLDHVLSGTSLQLEEVIQTIQEHAESAQFFDNGWRSLTSTKWTRWSNNFEGDYHAPSMLISLMEIPDSSNLSRLAIVLTLPLCRDCLLT